MSPDSAGHGPDSNRNLNLGSAMELKKNILVVDDDENVTEVLSFVLSKSGYNVLTAGNGRTGYDIYSSHSPDLVLLDLKMPEWDGLTVLKQIRIDDVETPVVLMTGYATIDSSIEAFKTGISDYVTKPFNFDRLLEVVDRLLSMTGGAELAEIGEGTREPHDPGKSVSVFGKDSLNAVQKAGFIIDERLFEADRILRTCKSIRDDDIERVLDIRRNIDIAREILAKLLDVIAMREKHEDSDVSGRLDS